MKTYRAPGFPGAQPFAERSKTLIFSGIVIPAFVFGGFTYLPSPSDVEAQANNLSNARTVPATLGLQPTIEEIESTYQYSPQLSLQKALDAIDTTDKKISISIEDVTNNISTNYKGDQKFISASLYKTLAAYRVLQFVDAGDKSLDDIVTHEGVPENTTLQSCIEKAITVSDNPCGSALQKLSDAEAADDLVREWGLKNTTLSGVFPETTANDQVTLMKAIYDGDRLKPESKKLLLGYLEAQTINDRTPSDISGQIYHKTGDLNGAIHSSAIIKTDTRHVYMISILTNDWDQPDQARYETIKQMHTSIYEALTANDL